MISPRQYQLIPCPFCDREAAMRVSEGMFGGSCVDLACLGYQMVLLFNDAAAAAAAWNRRAGSVHPDDVAVVLFAARMKRKLAKKREEGRGGWSDPATVSAMTLARELIELVAKGDPVDVGNVAMMLDQRGADARFLQAALWDFVQRRKPAED
ncbi:hypothetical protein [Burkholderia sp. Ed8]|uniref:hypothetical protein n=1 Tax=Burkholderia sp. Ed8 TaxID=3112957 RepID=UPI00345D330A